MNDHKRGCRACDPSLAYRMSCVGMWMHRHLLCTLFAVTLAAAWQYKPNQLAWPQVIGCGSPENADRPSSTKAANYKSRWKSDSMFDCRMLPFKGKRATANSLWEGPFSSKLGNEQDAILVRPCQTTSMVKLESKRRRWRSWSGVDRDALELLQIAALMARWHQHVIARVMRVGQRLPIKIWAIHNIATSMLQLWLQQKAHQVGAILYTFCIFDFCLLLMWNRCCDLGHWKQLRLRDYTDTCIGNASCSWC